MTYAEAQASDKDILAALHHRFCTPGVEHHMSPHSMGIAFAGWRESGALENARVAGRLEAQSALMEVLKGGKGVLPGARTQAAGRVLDREEHIKGLGKDVDRWRRRFLNASEADLRQLIGELAEEVAEMASDTE